MALLGFALGFYQWVFEAALIQRAGDPTMVDLMVGTTIVVLVFEAARRVLGIALPIVCALFLLYGLFGQYLPGELAHRPYDYAQIVDQLAFGTEGIYGIPTLVSATYIFLFILFGAFLEHAGMIKLFNDSPLAWSAIPGGPAKVAVISSGLMGTISGSGVANVLTVGQFTIPLMKRFGYSSVFAGAVEATASMGGQIMPPVMGAVAFIMAETLNVPYAAIVKAAVIPAFLYYFTAFMMVHLEAGRGRLPGCQKTNARIRGRRSRSTGIWCCRWLRSSTCCSRLHADVRRHDRLGAHRNSCSRRGTRGTCVDDGVSLPVLDRHGHRRVVVPAVGHRAGAVADRRARCRVLLDPGRPRYVAFVARQPDRRRAGRRLASASPVPWWG